MVPVDVLFLSYKPVHVCPDKKLPSKEYSTESEDESEMRKMSPEQIRKINLQQPSQEVSRPVQIENHQAAEESVQNDVISEPTSEPGETINANEREKTGIQGDDRYSWGTQRM